MKTTGNADLSKPGKGPIYVADDNESDRLLFSRLVQSAGLCHGCRSFTSGEELMDALIDVLRGAPAPVVCFVDINMTGMSGLDILRWIRAQPGLQTIPVVILSSSEDPQHVTEALQFGAQCYISKMPHPDRLREIVSTAERFCEMAACSSAFPLACNLLLGSASHAAVSLPR